jgi:hypothetical protein
MSTTTMPLLVYGETVMQPCDRDVTPDLSLHIHQLLTTADSEYLLRLRSSTKRGRFWERPYDLALTTFDLKTTLLWIEKVIASGLTVLIEHSTPTDHRDPVDPIRAELRDCCRKAIQKQYGQLPREAQP